MDDDVTLKDIATCLGLIDGSYEHRIREDLEINRLPAAVVPEGVLVEAFDERLKMQRVVRSFPSPLPSTTSSSLTCSPPRVLQVGALGSDALDDGRIFVSFSFLPVLLLDRARASTRPDLSPPFLLDHEGRSRPPISPRPSQSSQDRFGRRLEESIDERSSSSRRIGQSVLRSFREGSRRREGFLGLVLSALREELPCNSGFLRQCAFGSLPKSAH